MIVLVSSPNEMRSIFEQLKGRNIYVYPISSVDGAMKVLESGAVDYCLLSVDHSKIDIYELPQKIETELKVPVIAISELRDKQSMWRLTKVKTKNILYSKANAQNIFQRIQLIRSAQQASESKSAQLAAAAQLAKAEKERAAIREAAREEQRKNAKNDKNKKVVLIDYDEPVKEEKKVRLLTSPLNKSNSLGIVKLTTATKFRLEPVKTKFTEILNAPVRMLAPLTRKAAYEHLDLITSREHAEKFALKQDLLINPPVPEDTQKIILGCLTNVLSEFCNPNELTQKASEFGNTMVISINSKLIVGTFIIAAQSDVPKLGDIQTQLYDYLRTFGFDWSQEEIKVEILTDQKVPIELITAGVYVAGVAKEGEVAISYFPEAVKMPELGLTNNTQHVIDPSNLVKDTRINFDIFLHLRVNSRDLHYVKVGTDINKKQIEKISTSGLIPFVPRNQLKNLNEYVLLQRLLKLANPEELDDLIAEMLRVS